MQPDNELDRLLSQRRFEPPSLHLAERIATSAEVMGAWQPRQRWWEMLSELLLPKPAFALALTLVIGFAVGLETSSSADDDTQDIAGDFLTYEGEIL